MSRFKDEVDLMRSIPMLADLPANKLKLLAFASDRITYQAGDILFHQGNEADAAYIIISGTAKVQVTSDGQSSPSTVAELGPNAFFGDMAILCDIPRTGTLIANETLEVLRIRKEHVREMLKDSPELTMAVLKVLVQRLAKTTQDLSQERAKLAK